MHPNPIFRKTGIDQNLDFARQRAFATLVVNADPWPLISHVPFVLNAAGDSAELHLVRSNPIVQAASTPVPAILVISGPDSYVSPDWYGVGDQVPTWNYVAVHLRGTLSRLDQSKLPAVLDTLSECMESRLKPKPIWRREKMGPGVFDRMARMIVPFRFDVTQVDGTWKLSQNKPDEVRHAAAKGVKDTGFGMETDALCNFMNSPPDL